MGADTWITQAGVQEGNGPELVGVFLDQLIKLVGRVFVEAVLGKPFAHAQSLLIFPEPSDKLHAFRPVLFFA